MKKPQKIAAVISLLLISSILYAVTEIQYFTAKNENNAILLEWKTGTEDNLQRFEIERSASEPNNFIHIGNVTAIGNNSYYYFRDEMQLTSRNHPWCKRNILHECQGPSFIIECESQFKKSPCMLYGIEK